MLFRFEQRAKSAQSKRYLPLKKSPNERAKDRTIIGNGVTWPFLLPSLLAFLSAQSSPIICPVAQFWSRHGGIRFGLDNAIALPLPSYWITMFGTLSVFRLRSLVVAHRDLVAESPWQRDKDVMVPCGW